MGEYALKSCDGFENLLLFPYLPGSQEPWISFLSNNTCVEIHRFRGIINSNGSWSSMELRDTTNSQLLSKFECLLRWSRLNSTVPCVQSLIRVYQCAEIDDLRVPWVLSRYLGILNQNIVKSLLSKKISCLRCLRCLLATEEYP